MTEASLERATQAFLQELQERNPHEDAFHQAVQEVVESVMPLVLENPDYQRAGILERLTEPDRVVSFRVTWQTDGGQARANRAWRVQFNHALGPYKGGLRFSPTVTQSILKFLGFEQTFKNSLTGLPMGGGKGGSNFDPKGKSEDEVMRFCQSLMIELQRHIGEDVDVPAGDIGVGAREVNYLFGQYKRLENRWSGVMTGKGMGFGGSAVRTEATGYGAIYFLESMLEQHSEGLSGKRMAVSGSGNVAIYCAEKALQKGARVVTLSDSGGFVHFEEGLNEEHLAFVKDLKEVRRGRISEMAERFDGVSFHGGAKPWGVECDVAAPCATQNELDGEDAARLVKGGLRAVTEGANMPTTPEAIHAFRDAGVLHAPGKASNAGGVAVSGLEQSQNAMRLSWSHEEVDRQLQDIMRNIHTRCVEAHELIRSGTPVDYIHAANVAGFRRVAEAMLAQGLV